MLSAIVTASIQAHRKVKQFRFFLILLLLISLESCTQQQPLTVEIKLTSDSLQEGEYFPVELSVKNNTDSTIEYWEYECSWQFNWVFSDTSLHLHGAICNRNIGTIITLQAHQIKTYQSLIGHYSPALINGKKNYRIGLIFIRRKECKNILDFSKVLGNKMKQKKDIVWSNHFNLKTSIK